MAEGLTDYTQGSGGRAGAFWLGSLFGVCAGFGIGYYVAQRRLAQLAEDEIQEAQSYYRAKMAASTANTKESVDDLVKSLGYVAEAEAKTVEPKQDPEENTSSVPPEEEEDPLEDQEVMEIIHSGTQIGDDWDWPEEMRKRGDKSRPYIIHQDEIGEEEYPVVSYNWYPVNELLTDERDEPVDFADRDALVGEENLKWFGHGTGNPNLLNIRNDTVGIDIEIAVTEGDYYADVKGELLHGFDSSRRMRRRKFDDE